MNQFNRLRQSLVLQLSSKRFKKSDLIQAYQQLGYHIKDTNLTSKKQQLAETISNLVIKALEEKLRALSHLNLGKEQLAKEVSQQLQAKLQVFDLRGLSISKKIYDIFNLETLSHSNPIMSSNRQIKIYQQPVENIWTTNVKKIPCLCPRAPSNLEQSKKIQTCYRCNQEYHSQCFWAPERGEQFFQCPFCYLKFCMPQKEVKQILFGGYLPIMKKQKVQYKINFSLDPKTKADKSVFLEARCVKFNSKNRYEISWPDNGSFSIGKNRISQFKPLPTSSPLKRRADQPIKLDKNRVQVDNQIIIQERYNTQNGFKLNKKCYHLVAIMVVSQLPNEQVLSKMQKSTISVQQSKEQLARHMCQPQKHDIHIQKISISLTCQFFSQKIKLPCRSRLCNTHIQPFDLSNFINSSIHAKTSTKRWKCPICDKRAYDLIIDRYILELMRSRPDAKEIVFGGNGECEMIEAADESGGEGVGSEAEGEGGKAYYQFQRREKEKASIVIDIDDQQQPINVVPPPKGSTSQANKQLTNKNSLIIESEEQQERKKKQQRQKQRKEMKENRRQQQSLKNTKSNGEGQKKNSQYPRYEEADKIKLKKIRQLNDGSLEISNKDKKKDSKFMQNQSVLILSSDEEEVPPAKPTSKGDEKPFLPPLLSTAKKPGLPGSQSKVSTFPQKPSNPKKSSTQAQPQPSSTPQPPSQAQKPSSGSLPLTTPSLSSSLNPRQLIIDIDSDDNEENEASKSMQEINKEKYEEIMALNRAIEKQGKIQITEEDTDIFQTLYNRLLAKCE